MRSVFAFLRDTTEAEVAAYLDRTYPSQPGPPWVMLGPDGPSLYINFYREFAEEWSWAEGKDFTRRFGGEPAVAVMVDISGRIPGDEQVIEFFVGLPGHFLLRDKVDERVFIDAFHGGRFLDEEGCRSSGIGPERGETLGEVAALDKFHAEVALPVVLAHLVNRDNPHVIE